MLVLPGTVIWYGYYEDGIVFRVWDYRLDHSILVSFSIDVDVNKFERKLEVFFILSKAQRSALIASNSFNWMIGWQRRPLSSPHVIQTHPMWRNTQPLYFNMCCRDSKLHRFQIMRKFHSRTTPGSSSCLCSTGPSGPQPNSAVPPYLITVIQEINSTMQSMPASSPTILTHVNGELFKCRQGVE